MPATGWRGDRSLEQWLFDEPYAFEFLQAVRLLEMRFQASAPPGRGRRRPATPFASARRST